MPTTATAPQTEHGTPVWSGALAVLAALGLVAGGAMPRCEAMERRDEADARDVIEPMRLNYDRIVARYGLPDAA